MRRKKENGKRFLAVFLCMMLVASDLMTTGIQVSASGVEMEPDTAGDVSVKEKEEDVSSPAVNKEKTDLNSEKDVSAEKNTEDPQAVDNNNSGVDNEENVQAKDDADKDTAEKSNPLQITSDTATNGTYNDTITWSIESNGTLNIGGSGDSLVVGDVSAPWQDQMDNISAITVTTNGLHRLSFEGCKNLTSIDLSNCDTSQMTDIYNMFAGCSNLTSINLTDFDTSKATSMGGMFFGCSNLTNIDLTNFNTSQVSAMNEMFAGCSKLTAIDLASFDTSKVTHMMGMFTGCSSLIEIDLSVFDTSQVINTVGMFSGCSSLTSIDLDGFNTCNITSMKNMFSGCSQLTNISLSDFDTTNVTDMDSMFSGCSKLENIDTVSFDTDNVTIMQDMFSGCSSLTKINVYNFNTSQVYNMSGMFSGCSQLEDIDISGFDTSQVSDMSGMFSGCTNLIDIVVSELDVSNVTNISHIFENCSNLSDVDLSDFDATKVTDASDMLKGCNSLTKINTPYNLGCAVTLPASIGDTWQRANGNTITELPQNLSYSVAIAKNELPEKSISENLAENSVTMSRNGKNYDLLAQEQKFFETSSEKVNISVSLTNAKEYVASVQLMQNNTVAAQNAQGSFANIVPSQLFKPNIDIFVAYLNADGKILAKRKLLLSVWPKINIQTGQVVTLGKELWRYYLTPEEDGAYYFEHDIQQKEAYDCISLYIVFADDTLEEIEYEPFDLSAGTEYCIEINSQAAEGNSFRIVKKGNYSLTVGETVTLDGPCLGRHYSLTVEEDGIYYLDPVSGQVAVDWYLVDEDRGFTGADEGFTGADELYFLKKGKKYSIQLRQGYSGDSFRIQHADLPLCPLTLDEPTTLEAGEQGYYCITLEKYENYYLKLSSDSLELVFDPYVSLEEAAKKGTDTWFLLNCYESGAYYILTPKAVETTTLLFSKKPDFSKTVENWTDPITIPAGGAEYLTLTAKDGAGDYLLPLPNNRIDCNIIFENGFTYDYLTLNGSKYFALMNPFGKEDAEVIFGIENSGSEDITLTPLRETSFTPVTVETGQEYDGSSRYFSFIPRETGFYHMPSGIWQANWIYRQSDKKPLLYNSSSYVFLESGTAYLICWSGELFSIAKENVQYTEASGKSLELEAGVYYIFTPTETGIYVSEPTLNSVRCWSGCEKSRWSRDKDTGKYGHAMESGKSYYITSPAGARISLKRNVTILDHDHYKAFVASGGAVSLDGTITDGNAGWSLRSVAYSLYDFIRNGIVNVEKFAKGNLYWKTEKDGEYEASGYYRLQAPDTRIQADDIKDGDVLLVEYRPQIVWVQSMELKADQTEIPPGSSLQIEAVLDKGQDKYDFPAPPELRWESSDSATAEVDANGIVTAKQPGTVTVTAYADETLKKQEGLTDIVKASLELTITEAKPELQPEPPYSTIHLGQTVMVGKAPRVYYFIPETTGEYYIEFCDSIRDPYAYWYKFADDTRIEWTNWGECHLMANRRYYVQIYSAVPGNTFRIVKSSNREYMLKEGQEAVLEGTFVNRRYYFTPEKDGIYYVAPIGTEDGECYARWYKASDDEEKINGVQGRVALEKNTEYYVEVGADENVRKFRILRDDRFSGVFYPQYISTYFYGSLISHFEGGSYYGLRLEPEETYYLDLFDLPNIEIAVSDNLEYWEEDEGIEVLGMKSFRYGLKIKEGYEYQASDNQYLMVSGSDKNSGFYSIFAKSGDIWKEKLFFFTSVIDYSHGSDVGVVQISKSKIRQETITYPISVYHLTNKEVVGQGPSYICPGDTKNSMISYMMPAPNNITWESSNKNVAYIEPGNLEPKEFFSTWNLVIPTNTTSGEAVITGTYNDLKSSFRVVIYDDSVRLDTTSLKMNSWSNQWQKIYLSPNSQAGCTIADVEIADDHSVFELNPNADGTYYHSRGGYVEVRYKDNDKAQFDRETLTLKVTQSDHGVLQEPEKVSVAVTNKPTVPKTTVKLKDPYNRFWKNDNAFATLLIRSNEEITSIKKAEWDSSIYEIVEDSFTKVEGKANQWTVQVKAKDAAKAGASAVNVEIHYADYWLTSVGTVKIKTVNKAPAFKVYGANVFKPVVYQELNQEVTVLVEIPNGIEAGDITLAEASQRAFEMQEENISIVENYPAVVNTKGKIQILPRAARITLKAKEVNGKIKSANIRFQIGGQTLSKPVLTKNLKVTAKKLSSVKLLLQNTDTKETRNTYTFQKRWAGRETLSLRPLLSDTEIRDYKISYTVTGGNADGLNILTDPDDGTYVLQASDTLFGQSSCKLAFTAEIVGENGTVLTSLKPVTLTLKLKSAYTPVTAKASVKGTLNLVDPDSRIYITPIFRNLPMGAKITSAYTEDISGMGFFLNSDTGFIELMREGGRSTQTGKISSRLTYTIECGDMTEDVSTRFSMNVIQKATVKADTTYITLYNSSTGKNYGKKVGFTISKPAGASINSITVSGLEGSGISYKLDANKKLVFYVDPYKKRGAEQTYQVKATVLLEKAGEKNGKTITYTMPLMIELKN